MRLAMMIDLDKCVGCLACVTACKERWDSGPDTARDWVRTFEHGERENSPGLTFYPGLCMQCEEHPCTRDCPSGATWMGEDGIVVVDPQLCIGCGNCISTCVYHARSFDPVKGIVEKCNLCQPYVRRGELPACVSTCLAECRHFGDLDDADGDLVRRIARQRAEPLRRPDLDVGAKVCYAGEAHRQVILRQEGVMQFPRTSILTRIWSGLTRPLTLFGLPAFVLTTVAGGAVINFYRQRRGLIVQRSTTDSTDIAARKLERHKAAIRFLHWYNALTWILLLPTGLALMSAESFRFFGPGFSQRLAGVFGGPQGLLYFHVAWGLLWILITVPVFLLYKKGGREALREVTLTRDDLAWLLRKPFQLIGLYRGELPPQDKYNAGQKLYAILVVVATVLIMTTGLVMSFHLGPVWLVSASILLHKLAVATVLAGLAVHITMAVLMKEERPALASMITGQIAADHAAHHYRRWYEEKRKPAEEENDA